MLKCLPLREDFEENTTVFSCFLTLYRCQHPALAQHLPSVLQLCACVYSTNQADESKLFFHVSFGFFTLVSSLEKIHFLRVKNIS